MCYDLHRSSVDDGDLFGVRDVHEGARSIPLELKRFRMSRQFHLAEQLARGRIDRRQRAVAESDIQPLGHSVVSHVVGVVAKPNDSAGSIVVGTKQLQTLTLAVGDGYGSRVCRDGYPLWLTKSQQASQMDACPYIKHLNSVVAKRGHIQALRCRIVRKVIDATLDVRELDRTHQCQWLLRSAHLNGHCSEDQ